MILFTPDVRGIHLRTSARCCRGAANMATGSREDIFVCTLCVCVSSEMWGMFPRMPFLSPCISYFFCCCDKSNEVYGRVYSGLWFQRHKSPSWRRNRATSPESRKLITSTENVKQREQTGSERTLDNLKANPQWHPSCTSQTSPNCHQLGTNRYRACGVRERESISHSTHHTPRQRYLTFAPVVT